MRYPVPMAEETHERKLARWARGGRPGPAPVPAATVIVVRDADSGLETLMLRRSSKLAFVGGMWVFPGGRVDAADRDGAHGDEIATARRAAVREAREEAGLEVPAASLVPFSHWTPPPITPRRFLTWFFLAQAPAGPVVVDRGEIREHAWMSPAEALRRRDAQEIELAPPTFVTLTDLARFESVAEALAAARAREPERFETRIAVGSEGPVALWHGDAGYADSDVGRPGPRHRLWMSDSGWRYERGEG
jgi:8-oxo-dGTP pyrophosphatase MutT (NUDIX family)